MEAQLSDSEGHRRSADRIEEKIDVVEFKSKLQSKGIRKLLMNMQTTLDSLVKKTDGIDNALSMRTELIHKEVRDIQVSSSPHPPTSIIPSGLSDVQLATLSTAIESAVERSVSQRFTTFEQRLTLLLNKDGSVQTTMVPFTDPPSLSPSESPSADTTAEADPVLNTPPAPVSEDQDVPTDSHNALPQGVSQPTVEETSDDIAVTQEDALVSPQSEPTPIQEEEGTSSGRLSLRESVPSSPTGTSTSEESSESDKSIQEDEHADSAPSVPTIDDRPAGDTLSGERSPSIIDNRTGDPSEAGFSTSAGNLEMRHEGEGVTLGSEETGVELADGSGGDQVSRIAILCIMTYLSNLTVGFTSSGGGKHW